MGVPGSKHCRGEGLPPLPTESAVVESHSCKKTRKNGVPGSPEVAADVAAKVGTDVAAKPAALPGTEDA